MKTFAVRLNPDPREGKPYSAYLSASEYKAIQTSSSMDGFHEAVNFLPEGGIVRGYLPPRRSIAMRDGQPFGLITVTAKGAKIGGDRLIGFQIGCVYEGENPRTNVPKASRRLGLFWHYSCPSSGSLLLSKPLTGALDLVTGNDIIWGNPSTVEIPEDRFLRCLTAARSATSLLRERAAMDRMRRAILEGVSPDSAAFAGAVADAYAQELKEPPLGNPAPKQVRNTSYQFARDPAVVAYALRIAKGVCGDCRQPAPFVSKWTGLPYLEVHHKVTLAAGGKDTVDNVIALCPNCHRRRHHGAE